MPFLFAACWRLGAGTNNHSTSMEKESFKSNYTSPVAEVLTARVERGFGGSGFSSNSDQTDGTDGFGTKSELNYGNDLFS